MIDLSDTISRQQAITALRALSDEDGYINVPHEVVTDVVRGLPPVQAEHEQTAHSEQTKKDKFGVKTGETCEDCISRQAAIDALDTIESEVADGEGFQYAKWREYFCDLPSAQPERKTAKWNFIGYNMFECTCCGTAYTTQQLNGLRNYNTDPYAPKFCPNCGADMRGECNE